MEGELMASVIFSLIGMQKSLKKHLEEGNTINCPFEYVTCARPVIAKGNIFQGIEAKD